MRAYLGEKTVLDFKLTHERAKHLLAMSNQFSGLRISDDLCRAAVVLAVAGFDRYFTTKFCDVLVPRLKSSKPLGKDLLKTLEQAGFNTEFSLKLIFESVTNRRARPFRKIRTIVQQSLSSHTTHRDTAIDDLFRGLNLTDLTKNAEKMSGKKVADLMILVDLRNSIAHEAHVDANGKPLKVDARKIERSIDNLAVFVEACEEIVNATFGINPPISA